MPTCDCSPRRINAYAALKRGTACTPWTYESRSLRDNDVEIRISHCGVCASDTHALSGGWEALGLPPPPFPMVAGHEIAGVVARAGPGVSSVRIGQRVGLGCISESCQQCKQCLAGYEQYCPDAVFTYMGCYKDGHAAHGGYAEAVVVSADFVFPIPDAIPSEYAAPLMCAGITVYAPLKHYGAGPGRRVGIVGVGGLGHLALQFANKLGATVTAFSTSDSKREECMRLGAHHFVNTRDAAQFTAAQRSLDILLVTANASNMPWDGYIATLDVHGKVVTVGLPEEKLPANLLAMTFSDISLNTSLIGGRPIHREMLEFAAQHGIRPMIELLPMSQVNEAHARLHANKVRYRFVLCN